MAVATVSMAHHVWDLLLLRRGKLEGLGSSNSGVSARLRRQQRMGPGSSSSGSISGGG